LLEIASHFDFGIEECEVAEDHVHVLIWFPPRYCVSTAGGISKSISGGSIFQKYPRVKKKLWGGFPWEPGYFFRTVGEHVTDNVIKSTYNSMASPKSS